MKGTRSLSVFSQLSEFTRLYPTYSQAFDRSDVPVPTNVHDYFELKLLNISSTLKSYFDIHLCDLIYQSKEVRMARLIPEGTAIQSYIVSWKPFTLGQSRKNDQVCKK